METDISGWQMLLSIGFAGLLIWYLIYVIKNKPGIFSSEKMQQSFYTMGILALLLIVFIAFCILMLKQT